MTDSLITRLRALAQVVKDNPSSNWTGYVDAIALADAVMLSAHEAPQPVDLTNHHNALTCPHCNPNGLKLAHEAATPAAACGDGHPWTCNCYPSAEAAPVERPEPLEYWKEKEINAAHVALDKLGAPKTKSQLRRDGCTKTQEVTRSLSERIATLRAALPPSTERQP